MAVNPSNLEPSERMIICIDDFDGNLFRTKSFRCSFCKRGFSNAQALGGHMNIHRKDRAKLNELSCQNLLSLNITKNVDCEESPPSENYQCPDDKDKHLDDVREIPVNGGGKEKEGGGFDKDVERRKGELIKYGELDLELRLGPEPRHAKSKP